MNYIERMEKLYGKKLTDNELSQLNIKKRNVRPKDKNKVLIICEWCKKEILKYRSLVENQNHKHQFCGKECGLKYHRKYGFNKFSIK